MNLPIPEIRALAFAYIDAGRVLSNRDSGDAGADDREAKAYLRDGAVLLHFTTEDLPHVRRAAVEVLRLRAEGLDEWAARLAGDLG
jgi:hypothetical protein